MLSVIYAESRYAERLYSVCSYAECCYAECRGAVIPPTTHFEQMLNKNMHKIEQQRAMLYKMCLGL